MEFDELKRRLLLSGIVFCLVLIIGTVGYTWLGNGEATWFDGLYMTIITVSTIGYGEVIDMTDNVPARFFTIFIAFSGIGIVTYFLSNIAALVIEGELSDSFKKSKIKTMINKLDNHYIICGMGSVGMQVAAELHKTERYFVFGDEKKEKVDEGMEDFKNALGLEGDCREDEFMEELGIGRAKGVFVTTDDDNTNLVITLTAKQLNPYTRVIAICKDPGYIKKLTSVGADKVVSPSFIGGLRMASEMIRPTVTTFLDVMLRDQNRNLRIEDVKISKRFEGKPLSDIPVNELKSTLILALRERDDWVFKPASDHIIQPKSILVVMTNPQERTELEAMCADNFAE